MEMICTAIFASVILHVKKINGSKNEDILNAATISGTLYCIIRTVGSATGGCFNPAVGLA